MAALRFEMATTLLILSFVTLPALAEEFAPRCGRASCPSVSWVDAGVGETTSFTLRSSSSGSTNNYVAFAFATAQQMSSAQLVVDCYDDNGVAALSTSRNAGYANQPAPGDEAKLQNRRAARDGGVLTCSFDLVLPSLPAYVLIAEGRVSAQGGSVQKQQHQSDGRHWSETQYLFVKRITTHTTAVVTAKTIITGSSIAAYTAQSVTPSPMQLTSRSAAQAATTARLAVSTTKRPSNSTSTRPGTAAPLSATTKRPAAVTTKRPAAVTTKRPAAATTKRPAAASNASTPSNVGTAAAARNATAAAASPRPTSRGPSVTPVAARTTARLATAGNRSATTVRPATVGNRSATTKPPAQENGTKPTPPRTISGVHNVTAAAGASTRAATTLHSTTGAVATTSGPARANETIARAATTATSTSRHMSTTGSDRYTTTVVDIDFTNSSDRAPESGALNAGQVHESGLTVTYLACTALLILLTS